MPASGVDDPFAERGNPSSRSASDTPVLLRFCGSAVSAPVKVSEPHFPVFAEFKDASYAKRYDLLLTKLVRERLYDASCLLMSTLEGGLRGEYREPNPELRFQNFLACLLAHATAISKAQGTSPPPA